MSIKMEIKVGPFFFIYKADAIGYLTYLDKWSKPEIKPLDDVPTEDNCYSIDGVPCFTFLRYNDTICPQWKGYQFMEDVDGVTPVRFLPETSDQEIREFAAWWIWYRASKKGGLSSVRDDMSPVWRWETGPYPELRTWIGPNMKMLLGIPLDDSDLKLLESFRMRGLI